MSALDQIEARLSAATPGPWAWRNTSEPYLMGVRTRIVMAFRRMGTQGAQPQFRDEHGLLVDAGRENINDFPDAALIAHAPADLTALLEFVHEIQALATEWTFTGKGEPDDMPDEFQLTRDECAFALRKRLDALNGGAS